MNKKMIVFDHSFVENCDVDIDIMRSIFSTSMLIWTRRGHDRVGLCFFLYLRFAF
jgi:hypothetical protein